MWAAFMAVSLICVLMLAPRVSAQAAASKELGGAANQAAGGGAAYSGYKGVMVGMPMNEARAKLGKARDTSDTEDFFVYSDKESAQVLYDTDKTVKVISVNFMDAAGAPSAKDVFGADAEAKPDGSIYKMVRYPKAGYWISYNRTAGDEPMIIVTVHKLQRGQ